MVRVDGGSVIFLTVGYFGHGNDAVADIGVSEFFRVDESDMFGIEKRLILIEMVGYLSVLLANILITWYMEIKKKLVNSKITHFIHQWISNTLRKLLTFCSLSIANSGISSSFLLI